MIIKPQSGNGEGLDLTTKPQIWFSAKWSGWYVEIYDGVPYWEALFSESGTLTVAHGYTCDAWGIGGGGAGGNNGDTYPDSTGGGSGYTAMIENAAIPTGNTKITIGKGGDAITSGGNTFGAPDVGADGGETKFLTLTALGGGGGGDEPGAGGSNGGKSDRVTAGENGTPGDGKIMSKFWSVEHNTEYGAAGQPDSSDNAPGGGGFKNVGAPCSTSGRGYGGGGGGFLTSGAYAVGGYTLDWMGHDGCLIIRIKAA